MGYEVCARRGDKSLYRFLANCGGKSVETIITNPRTSYRYSSYYIYYYYTRLFRNNTLGRGLDRDDTIPDIVTLLGILTGFGGLYAYK